MPNAPRLAAIATAVPPYAVGQAEVTRRAALLYDELGAADLDRMMPVFANAGIERRYSCVPIDWYETPRGWTERNALYLEHAAALLEQAARDCLDRAGLAVREIDAVVAVSTTGIATPSLDALLSHRMGMRPDVKRLPIFGLGCAGGVLGLARAADWARAMPGANVLFLVVELCALSFRRNDTSKSNIVATALFGDGAAAAIISGDGDGPTFGPGGEHLFPASLDVMGWDVGDDGLRAIFSRDIPQLVRSEMRTATGIFLARHGLDLYDINRFICHPGGTKVIAALEEAFGLAEHALAVERAVLRDHGNMSAATLLFVLERALRQKPRGKLLLTAMGPGFTAGFQLLQA
ncbi:MAG TPA: 3-oxoacyl-[acyl-carrier-protein] synthase III C-terminal domain-containing protein [Stellaceae bacterium]|nr:3-oxoacyl-[acyl-carrier-protein] synthase III C-terminal domain-containing protein [Stellaceae bacterium]